MRRHRAAVAAVIPLLALGLSACGGDGPAAAAKSPNPAGDQDKMRQFAQCMRANGVDMPDPEVDENGGVRTRMGPGRSGSGGEAEMKAAMGKCRHLMPNGGNPIKLSAEDVAKLREFAKCMREHGVEMPDPDADGRVTVRRRKGEEGGLNPDDPAFKAAEKACRKYRPNLRPKQ